eukprot:1159833-Pelagomonas_calceolata.AAC.3
MPGPQQTQVCSSLEALAPTCLRTCFVHKLLSVSLVRFPVHWQPVCRNVAESVPKPLAQALQIVQVQEGSHVYLSGHVDCF